MLTVGLTVQPSIVKNICNNKTFRGRGLLGRFLYVMPKSNIGSRTLEEPSMAFITAQRFREVIKNILEHPDLIENYLIYFAKKTNNIVTNGGIYQVVAMDLSTFITQNHIFTIDEIKKYYCISGKSSTLKNLLGYHLRCGHLIHIRRGLYYTVPKGVDSENCPVDPYLVTSKLAQDSVLAYHTALAYLGGLYTVRNDFVFLTQTKVKTPFTFREVVFHASSVPSNLVSAKSFGFGVQSSDHLGHKILVTNLERTLVDVLDRPSLTGSWEEIWRSLEGVEYFNLDQVLQYALLLGNATTIAKLGFFLEMHQERLMVQDCHLEELHSHCPSKPHYLERSQKQHQKLIKKWNLIVPIELINRNWEEPNENI